MNYAYTMSSLFFLASTYSGTSALSGTSNVPFPNYLEEILNILNLHRLRQCRNSQFIFGFFRKSITLVGILHFLKMSIIIQYVIVVPIFLFWAFFMAKINAFQNSVGALFHWPRPRIIMLFTKKAQSKLGSCAFNLHKKMRKALTKTRAMMQQDKEHMISPLWTKLAFCHQCHDYEKVHI